MFCYLILHDHKGWALILPQSCDLNSPRLKAQAPSLCIWHLTPLNSPVLSPVVMDNAESHTCYWSPRSLVPKGPECDDRSFTCVSYRPEEAKIRDQTCNPCQDKSSAVGDVILNPRMMLKNQLRSSFLGNWGNFALRACDPVTLDLGRGRQKLGFRRGRGSKPAARWV